MSPLAEKILTALAMPMGTALLTAAVGLLALVLGRRWLGTGLVAFAVVWLWLWSAPAVVYPLAERLVVQHRLPAIEELPTVDAIVVLLSDVEPAGGRRPWSLAQTTADTLRHGARLYAAGKAPTVITSGTSWRSSHGYTGAHVMRELLVPLGVPASAVLAEGESFNTRENAVFTARLAAKHGIERVLLVTRAVHMNRALGAFRKAGLATTPAPTSGQWRMARRVSLYACLPQAKTLHFATRHLHEWLGEKVYRWRGWI